MHRFAAVLAGTTLTLTAFAVVGPSGPAAAGSLPCERTYASSVDVPIDSSATQFLSTIDVPEGGLLVADVDVAVDIIFSIDGELTLNLTHLTDGGATTGSATLFLHRGGEGNDLSGTIFDDSSAVAIGSGASPFAGRFRPETTLAGITEGAGGAWRLSITDALHNGDGALLDWSVTLTYADCPTDNDRDGVDDHVDSCVGLAAASASGCPVTSRSVSAAYRKGKFKGALASPVGACNAARSVTVWKVRSGPDRKVGAATTRSDGAYRVVHRRHSGKYYATSPGLLVAGVAECPAVQSATFRIR